MTIACVDCSTCGKCYPKIRACPNCNELCDFEEDHCSSCGSLITDEHRKRAQAEYRRMKKEEHTKLFANMKRNKN